LTKGDETTKKTFNVQDRGAGCVQNDSANGDFAKWRNARVIDVENYRTKQKKIENIFTLKELRKPRVRKTGGNSYT